jgi:hypothetical protein
MAEIASGSPTVGIETRPSYLEWGPILAGAVTAAALSFVMLTFGAALGLTSMSPWPHSGFSAKTVATLAVFWVLAQQIGAFLAGGYIAGRMRTRWDSSKDETDFRDGLHGLLVWAVGICLGAALLFSAAGGAARTTTISAAGAAGAAATTGADPTAYFVDVMIRPQGSTQARTEGASPEQRAEVGRIMTRSLVTGALSANDKSYLSAVVAQRTGLPQAEAEKRVTDTVAEFEKVTRETADKGRRAAVLAAFATAASLVISLAAAWWAALRGGHHRDSARSPQFNLPPIRRLTPHRD